MTVKRDIKNVSYEEVQDLAIKIKALPEKSQICYCYLQGKEVFLAECYRVQDRLRDTLGLLEKNIYSVENELKDDR